MRDYKENSRYNDDFYIQFSGLQRLESSSNTGSYIGSTSDWTISWDDILDNSSSNGVSSLDQSSHSIYNNLPSSGGNGISVLHRIITVVDSDLLITLRASGVDKVIFINNIKKRTTVTTISMNSLVYTSSDNTCKFYVNGELHTTISNFTNGDFASSEPASIGSDSIGSTNRGRVGSLRNIVFSSKAFSYVELAYLYDTGTIPTSAYSSIEHYYPLNEIPIISGQYIVFKDKATLFNTSAASEDLTAIGWTLLELGLSGEGFQSATAYKSANTNETYNFSGLTFDGLGSRVSVSSLNGLSVPLEFTIKVTYKRNSNDTSDVFISSLGVSGQSYLAIRDTSTGVQYLSAAGLPLNRTFTNVPLDYLVHTYVFVTSSGLVKLFVDGKFSEEFAMTIPPRQPGTFGNFHYGYNILYNNNNGANSNSDVTLYDSSFINKAVDDYTAIGLSSKGDYTESDLGLLNSDYLYKHAFDYNPNYTATIDDLSPNNHIGTLSNFTNEQPYNVNYRDGLNFDSSKEQYLEITGLENFGKEDGYTFLVGMSTENIQTGFSRAIFSCQGDEGVNRAYLVRRRGGVYVNQFPTSSPNITSISNNNTAFLDVDASNLNFISSHVSNQLYQTPFSSTKISRITDINCQQTYSSDALNDTIGYANAAELGFNELTNPRFSIGRNEDSSNRQYLTGGIYYFSIIKGQITKEEDLRLFNNGFFRSPYEVLEDTSKIILDVDFQNPFVDGTDIKFTDNSENCILIAKQDNGNNWNTLAGVQNSIYSILSTLLTWETTTANELIQLPMSDSVTIDWGDGTITNGVTSHTYATAGTYQVTLTGIITNYNNSGGNQPNKDDLQIVERFGGIEVRDFFMWNNTNMDITATDLPTITSLTSAFRQCNNLVGNSSFNDWDTSNATTMTATFAASPLFNQPLGNWDTSSVTNISRMFEAATNFNQDLTYWDLSNVTTTQEMFEGATNFNGDISEWKLGSLENTFLMFRLSDFNGDVSTKTVTNYKGTYTAWDMSTVTSLNGIFRQCPFNQPLNSWDTSSVINMSLVFYLNSDFNQDLDQWDTSSVTTFYYMFRDAIAFNSNITTWDTSSSQNMNLMFNNAEVFNQDLSTKVVTVNGNTYTAWDTSSVNDMAFMFGDADDFNQDIGNWNTSSVEETNNMFQRVFTFNQDISTKVVTVGGNTYVAWNMSNVITMKAMFYASTDFNGNITNWDTSSVNNMNIMFRDAVSVNQDLNTKSVTVNGVTYNAWDVGTVTTMDSMFYNAKVFNQDLDNWNTSNAVDMGSMFLGASDFNGNITNWDTSSLEQSNNMFQACVDFNQDINTKAVTVNGNTYTAWDMSTVINARAMLRDTISFNQDIGNWDTSSMTDMGYLFDNAALFNQDISTKIVTVNGNTYTAWDTSSVTIMDNTFVDADSFNQDISSWDFSSVTDIRSFMGGKTSANYDATNYDNLLIKWDNAVGGLVFSNMTDVIIGMGTIKYTSAGASARASLVSKGFIINDGGQI